MERLIAKTIAAKRNLIRGVLQHIHAIGLPAVTVGPVGEFEFGAVPNLRELQQYMVVRPDAVEAVRQPLYDRLIYPAAGTLQLRFYQTQQGAGVSSAPGNAGGVKVLDDTNMEAAGQLPSPKAFLATSIEVIFEPGSTSSANVFAQLAPAGVAAVPTVTSITQLDQLEGVNDAAAVLSTGWLDFFIMSKSYLQNARLDSFPPKTHIAIDAATSMAAGTAATTVGSVQIALARAVGRPYYLNPPVLLLPNANFTVNLNWVAAVPTPSGQNGRITVRLDGFLYRNAQ